jgi:hypothetical protein
VKIAVAALLLAAVTSGQESPQAFTTIGGERFEAIFETLVDGSSMQITRAGEKVQMPLDELAVWHRIEPSRSTPTRASIAGQLRSRSGLDLPCEVITADQETVSLNLESSRAAVDFSFRYLESLRFMPTREDDAGFARALKNPSSSSDLLFALNRENEKLSRLSVIVQGFDGENVLVLFRDRVRSVPLIMIYGLVFGSELGIRPEEQNRPTVTLKDDLGNRLSGRLLDWNGEVCHLLLPEGPNLEIDCARVQSLKVQSSRVQYMSDLIPTVEQVPAFDRIRPWLVDSAPSGPGLELGGKSYSRGLCMIPHTRLSYSLPEQFGYFEAIIGIDDRSSREAHADFRVYLDDELVFEAKGVRHGQPGQALRLPLENASSLVLETDFGDNFDLGDHCIFADARLLKN